jgi:hypothetical protein
MTTQDLVTAIRRQYNSVGDSFFSDDEILNLIYQACLDMNAECGGKLIERVYTTSTVAAQQEYDYPTSTMSIKRIQYDGQKLSPIDFREDDAITGMDQDTTSSGTPQYYMIFNETIYLRPIPSGVGTLKIWSFNEPQALTISSTLEIPTQFHMNLREFCLAEMAMKDSNAQAADRYLMNWEKSKLRAKKWTMNRKRADSFGVVKDEAQLNETYLGVK